MHARRSDADLTAFRSLVDTRAHEPGVSHQRGALQGVFGL